MQQIPATGSQVLRTAGDLLEITLRLPEARPGRAVFRSNLNHADIRRAEIIAFTERDIPPPAKDWHDLPMFPAGDGVYHIGIRLTEPGFFAGKACFLPEGSDVPEWPEGENLRIKVAPAHTASANGIYAAFIRQFRKPHRPELDSATARLDAEGYTVIPPSGTFRSFAEYLPHITQTLGFRNILLLPVHPVPTTYGKMGRYGSAFAALDFMDIDPALAEFDTAATPMEQFVELIGRVHAHGAKLFMDIPANHTAWGSTLQTNHPEWFKRNADGSYHSPGAWGVVWADLVELDYSHPELRAFMAEVFLFWCRKGADGFRCDAGYMIPADTWTYITARVREEFPDTVFLLEGLGGLITTTDRLLGESNLDWAYSELFQTYDRGAMEHELPGLFGRSETLGSLVHFAETHDNDRLAARGKTWAKMRVRLCALLSNRGAWGITAGVEWLATEKIAVHGASALNQDSPDTLISEIAVLNHILSVNPAFGPEAKLRMVQRGEGNTLAILRECAETRLLILVNLDAEKSQPVSWNGFDAPEQVWNLLSGQTVTLPAKRMLLLEPGEVFCLSPDAPDTKILTPTPAERRRCLAIASGDRIRWNYPEDTRRIVPLTPGAVLDVQARQPFRVFTVGEAVRYGKEDYRLSFRPRTERFLLEIYQSGFARRFECPVALLPPAEEARVRLRYTGHEIRADRSLRTLLTNGTGAMAQVRPAWGELRSQYDALLALNLNDGVPVDRTVFWTRCRAWLRFRGYSAEIGAACLDSFTADPSGRSAQWDFLVPCGMGQQVPVTFRLETAEGINQIRLRVRVSGDLPEVTLVFRPDIEWRSFHSKTKAYAGAEREHPAAISDSVRGFGFHGMKLSISHGRWHRDDAWTYSIEHPDDAERGLDGLSDLYSPGWFSTELAPGTETILTAGVSAPGNYAAERHLPDSLPMPEALGESLAPFIVRRDNHKTVIAGYPWFLDWGRDTLIAARGILAAGRTETVFDLLSEFGRFEENGTLPNIIHGETVGNRDTADAPLWFCAAAADLANVKGVQTVLKHPCGNRTVKDVILSILNGYRNGTPNGIRMNPRTGLIYCPSHYTWMDTNYPAGTPRVGYPVEIQALWIAALGFAAQTIDASFEEHRKRALESFLALYPLAEGGLSDCLQHEDGSVQDDAVRPNQLFAVTLGVLDEHPALAASVLEACACLLQPGSIRSLADRPVRTPLRIVRDGVPLTDPHHPYKPFYTGDEDTARKPAYHNGTGWTWVFPQYCEALAKVRGTSAVPAARALLASAVRLINRDCICQVPENTDGDAPHLPKGCGAQAWGVSEILRVWKLLSD